MTIHGRVHKRLRLFSNSDCNQFSGSSVMSSAVVELFQSRPFGGNIKQTTLRLLVKKHCTHMRAVIRRSAETLSTSWIVLLLRFPLLVCPVLIFFEHNKKRRTCEWLQLQLCFNKTFFFSSLSLSMF